MENVKLKYLNKTTQLLLSLFLMAGFSLQLLADSTTTAKVTKIGSMELKRWNTSNGMPVLFAQSKDLPIVDLRLVFDAGGARDMDADMQLPGLAKLTNGLIYEGSKGLSAQHIAEMFEGIFVQPVGFVPG